MLKTFVKINAVTNLSDARYAAGMGVDMIGFDLDSLPKEAFTDISSWLAGVQFVGESKGQNEVEIKAKLADFGLSTLQIEHPELVPCFDEATQLILRLDIDAYATWQAFKQHKPQIVAYILYGKSLTDVQLHELKEYTTQFPILLELSDLDASSTNDLLAELPQIKGIVLKGSEEIRPGYSQYDSLMDILEALEV